MTTLQSAPPSTRTPSSRSTRTDRSRDSDPIVKTPPPVIDPAKGARRAALKRELQAIALLLFGVFLGGALIVYAAATVRTPFDTTPSIGGVGNWLVRPLIAFFGWPAAFLIPVVPIVHALRLFGRLESETDRSWMIFFGGIVFLLPIAIGLALPPAVPGLTSPWSGLWGDFVAMYAARWFGMFGAWVGRDPGPVGADGRDAGLESDPDDRRQAGGDRRRHDRRAARGDRDQAKEKAAGGRQRRRSSRGRGLRAVARAITGGDAGRRVRGDGSAARRRRRRSRRKRRRSRRRTSRPTTPPESRRPSTPPPIRSTPRISSPRSCPVRSC